jgi:SAM-dependent methyltransferase
MHFPESLEGFYQVIKKMKQFDLHWKENRGAVIPAVKAHEAQKFLSPLFAAHHKTEPPVNILDIGCGDGVHVEAVLHRMTAAKRNLWVGVDISLPALVASQQRGRGRWSFVQGDAGRLPLKSGMFDAVFSFGSIAYTQDPPGTFREMCRMVRRGGLIGMWIYPKTKGIRGVLFSWVRELCAFSGHRGTRLIADCIVPLLPFLPTRSKISLANADWRQCREVVLVNIAPERLYFPDATEVRKWFTTNQIRIISWDDQAPITVWGEKC